MLAILVGFALTVRDVVLVYERGCMTGVAGNRRYRSFCAVEILDTVFLLPCTVHLACLIGTYGDRCQHLARAAAQRKLAQAYNTMVEEMDVQLQRACDSNVFLAERAFSDKRRDFLHFCEGALNTCGQVPEDDRQELVNTLRELIRLWLQTYSEASIDPAGRPLNLDPDNALGECMNLEDLIKTSQKLVSNTVVATARFRQDLQAMSRIRDATSDPESRTSVASAASGARVSLEVGVRELRKTLRLSHRHSSTEQCFTWLRCCSGPWRCRCGSTDPEDTECEISCFCCGVTLLSKDHALMMIALFAGCALIVVHSHFLLWDPELTWDKSYHDAVIDILPLIVYVLCLLFLLTKVEGISTLLLLKQHIQQIVNAQKKIEAMRESLVTYWLEVTDLTEFWLHRTMPRLDLMKEMHCQLLLCKPEKLKDGMEELSEQLKWLEQAIGEAHEWWEARRQGQDLLPLGPRVDRILRTPSFMLDEDVLRSDTGSFSHRLEVLLRGFELEFADEVIGERPLKPGGNQRQDALQGGAREALEILPRPSEDSIDAWAVGLGQVASLVQTRTGRAWSVASDFVAPLISMQPMSMDDTEASAASVASGQT